MHNSLEALISNVNEENFTKVLEDADFTNIMSAFENHLEYLRNNNGPLSTFWMSYLDLVDIMLNLTHAS